MEIRSWFGNCRDMDHDSTATDMEVGQHFKDKKKDKDEKKETDPELLQLQKLISNLQGQPRVDEEEEKYTSRNAYSVCMKPTAHIFVFL